VAKTVSLWSCLLCPENRYKYLNPLFLPQPERRCITPNCSAKAIVLWERFHFRGDKAIANNENIDMGSSHFSIQYHQLRHNMIEQGVDVSQYETPSVALSPRVALDSPQSESYLANMMDDLDREEKTEKSQKGKDESKTKPANILSMLRASNSPRGPTAQQPSAIPSLNLLANPSPNATNATNVSPKNSSPPSPPPSPMSRRGLATTPTHEVNSKQNPVTKSQPQPQSQPKKN